MVNGHYLVEVRLFNYANPSGRCQGCPLRSTSNSGVLSSCCDDFGRFFRTCNSYRLCDNYFIYCLRPFGSTEIGCSSYVNSTSTVNTDDGPIDFSQGTVLGLPNPLLFKGFTGAYTVSGWSMHGQTAVLCFSISKIYLMPDSNILK